ncbi:MAG TPA: glycosyltransferase [Thermoleophilaceae bacterium]|jgi:glycosyltransferase involved in cell wall biosynthesis
MRVCVVAEFYPRRRDPVLGVWAHRQALAARAAGADVRVLALERPLPTAAALRVAVAGRPAEMARQARAAARQPRRDVLDGIEVEYVRFVSPPRERGYAGWHRWARRPLARALDRLHRERPIDLVHAHYALPAGAAALPWVRGRGLPLAVSVHGGDLLAPLLTAPAPRATARDVLRAAAVTICNSRGILELAARVAGGAERMRVIHPPGAPPPSPLPAKREQPTVATLAHAIPRKRHADVLEALVLLRERVPDARWLAIGDGPELPALRERARALGMADRVELAGRLDPAAAMRELARCHLMAMPSVDEAFGVSYVEALTCGVPAIGCAGEPGPEEIAGLAEGMVLVPPRDPGTLADAIGAAMSDPAALAELSSLARRTAAAAFGPEACGRATMDAYRDALAT